MRSFSQLTGREKSIEVLRWICVVPVALVSQHAGDVITFCVVVRPFMIDSDYGETDRWLRHLVSHFFGGAPFVVMGAKLAPRHRFVTAVTLATYSLFVALLIHWPHRDEKPIVATAVAATCGVAYTALRNRAPIGQVSGEPGA